MYIKNPDLNLWTDYLLSNSSYGPNEKNQTVTIVWKENKHAIFWITKPKNYK